MSLPLCHLPLPVSHLFAYRRIFSKIETSVFCPTRLKQENVGFYGKPSPMLSGKAWLQLPKEGCTQAQSEWTAQSFVQGISGSSLPVSKLKLALPQGQRLDLVVSKVI